MDSRSVAICRHCQASFQSGGVHGSYPSNAGTERNFSAEKGYELSVIYLGKTATFVLMAALAFVMLTTPDTLWPDVLLYIGIGLSLAAGAVYVATVSRRLGKPSSNT